MYPTKQHEVINTFQAVPDAYVPVINMKFSGVQIDLLFARLALSIIPDDLDLLDEQILKNLDDKSILSLNGRFSSLWQYIYVIQVRGLLTKCYNLYPMWQTSAQLCVA